MKPSCKFGGKGFSSFSRRLVSWGMWRSVGAACLVGGVSLGVYDHFYTPDFLTRTSWVRCGRAAQTVSVVCFDYQLSGREGREAAHQRAAERFLRLAVRNKGVYIKLGQHAASLDYLLPKQYVQEFKVLHSDAPKSSIEDIHQVIKKELQIEHVEDVFSDFDPNPVGAGALSLVFYSSYGHLSDSCILQPACLGAASLAQVHFATLRDSGEHVAVKVQHPEVKELAKVDIRTIGFLVSIALRFFPNVKFEWLADLMENNLPIELDFTNEGRNAEKAANIFRGHASYVYRLHVSPFFLASPSAFFRRFLKRMFYSRSSEVTSHMPKSVVSNCEDSLSESASTETLPTKDLSGEDIAASHSLSVPYCSEYEVEFHVPEIYWNVSSKRILVMERCGGCAINDLHGIKQQGIHPLVVSRALGELYSRLIFEEGFIHADPHPGNLLVQLTNDGKSELSPMNANCETTLPTKRWKNSGVSHGKGRLRVSLLDHGLYCYADESFRYHYSLLWQGLLTGDFKRIRSGACYFGVTELEGLLACIVSGRTMESIQKGVRRIKKTDGEVALLRSRLPDYFVNITEVLDRVPRELVLILKTNDLVRSIQRSLGLDEVLALLPLSRSSLGIVTHVQLQRANGWFQRCWLRVVYWWNVLKLSCVEWLLILRLLRRESYPQEETLADLLCGYLLQ